MSSHGFSVSITELAASPIHCNMYHVAIMIIVTSSFAYSYTSFISGMLISVLFSWMMTKVVDPIVDSYRDQIRGRRLQTPDEHGMPISAVPQQGS
jgi:hypothetical protein